MSPVATCLALSLYLNGTTPQLPTPPQLLWLGLSPVNGWQLPQRGEDNGCGVLCQCGLMVGQYICYSLAMHLKPKDVQRFFDKIAVVGDCWEWQGRTRKDGYGVFVICEGHYKLQYMRAHRVSYLIHNGFLPASHFGKQQIRHLCHNKKCVRPSHLELGSNAENYRDSMLRVNPHWVKGQRASPTKNR